MAIYKKKHDILTKLDEVGALLRQSDTTLSIEESSITVDQKRLEGTAVLDTAVTGIGGIDNGTVINRTSYNVFAVDNGSGILALIASASLAPADTLYYKLVGTFIIDDAGLIQLTYNLGEAQETDIYYHTRGTTTAGYGSGETAIARFVTEDRDLGVGAELITDGTGTLGDYYEIKEDGIYHFSARGMVDTGAFTLGITVNAKGTLDPNGTGSDETSTAIDSVSADRVIKKEHTIEVSEISVAGERYLYKNDRVRVHTDLSKSVTTNVSKWEFTVTSTSASDLKGKISNSAVFKTTSDSTGSSAVSITKEGHTFALGDAVHHDGLGWEKSRANNASTLAQYVITEIVSADKVIAAKFGRATVAAHGFTVGEYYYLDSDVAGTPSSTDNTAGFSQPLFFVEDPNNLHISVYRPSIIGDGSISDSEIGAIVAFGTDITPEGFLPCNGIEVSRVTYSALFDRIGEYWGYGDQSTTFNLPDLRGVFLRGVDEGVEKDPDRATRTAINTGGNTGDNVGSYQDEQLKSHRHTYGLGHNLGFPPSYAAHAPGGGSASPPTSYTGGNETRPKNAYVKYYIRYAPKGAVLSVMPAGLMLPFGGSYATVPQGFLACDGSAVSRTTYATLFGAIGVTNGSGDGSTTFNLPDLRGKFVRGVVAIADQTFEESDVEFTTNDRITITGHGFNRHGFKVRFTSGGLPTGISPDTTYYLRIIDDNNVELYPTLSDCLAETNKVNILDNGTGTHTVHQWEDPDAESRVASTVGANSGDNIGSLQEDELASHTHTTTLYEAGTTNNVAGSGSVTAAGVDITSATGGDETRPRNIGFAYVISTGV